MTTGIKATIERVGKLMRERPAENTPAATNGLPLGERMRIVDSIMTRRLPAEYAGARPPDVPELLAVNPVGDGWGACFRGNPGIGKTYAAAALAYKLLLGMNIPGNEPPDKFLQFEMAPYLFIRIRDTFKSSATETEKRIVDDMVRARVLILDDLGAERNTEYTASTLCTIIAKRRNDRRITIVTTNQSLDEVDEWSGRIASRLEEMAPVMLPDRDRRMRK